MKTFPSPDCSGKRDMSADRKGKVRTLKPDLEYIIVKIVKTGNQDAWEYTYYTRDPQGNVLAVYKRTFTDNGSGNYTDNFDVEEHDIYSGSRTGIRKGTDIAVQQTSFTSSITLGIFVHPTFGTAPSTTTWSNGHLLKRTLGYKEYELTNHLGNVLETVSDKRLIADVYTYSASTTNYSYNAVNGHYYYTPGLGSYSRSSGSDGKVDYYSADVLSYTDYYAFGTPMPGRNGSSSSYRYGFNDKENDHEAVGTADGTQDYGMRIYNPSLGRFLSVDPLIRRYSYLTPYAFAENDVIRSIDLDGTEREIVNTAEYNKNMAAVLKANGGIGSSFIEQAIMGVVGAQMAFMEAPTNMIYGVLTDPVGYNQNLAMSIVGQPFKYIVSKDASWGEKMTYMITGPLIGSNIIDAKRAWSNNDGYGFGYNIEDGTLKVAAAVSLIYDMVPSLSDVEIFGVRGKQGAPTARNVSEFAKEHNIMSGQKSLGNDGGALVDKYLDQMRKKRFDTESGAAGFDYYDANGNHIFTLTEGNHRMNAAIKYGLETGDYQYVEQLINNGNFTRANPKAYGIKSHNLPTK